MVRNKLRILFLTGSHPRHQYISRKLDKTGKLIGIICQKRESLVPKSPENIKIEAKALFELHFKKREESENKFFGEALWPDIPIMEIEKSQQNSKEVLEKIKALKPNLLLTYGCGILSREVIDSVDGEAWNIHGGLSPWYKGGITMFWPSYMLQPQMTGMTIHDLTTELDAGDVIHQCVADLVRGDGIHDLSCRAVEKLGKEITVLIKMLVEGKKIIKKSHKTSGKLWIGKDWRPEHLELIYKFYNDQIVDHYLNGDFLREEPNLHRQFK
tara:strand:- start:1760 stop:2569 length:810 start_codon:yes stop_codon:yes gene_type:complete